MDQFNKVAKLYSKVRPTYPDLVYESILNFNNNKKYNLGLDVGCGAGHSIEGLKSICNEIIGIEPWDNLRNEAIKKHPDLKFIKGSGENTMINSNSCDLITVATAFYWMNREKAIKEFSRILLPNGKVVLYRYMFPTVESKTNYIIENHCLNYWDKYREERLTREDDSDKLLQKSLLFNNIKKIIIPNVLKFTIEDFVGFLMSTSYVSRYLESIGSNKENYIQDLIKELNNSMNSSFLKVNFDIHMIFANKNSK